MNEADIEKERGGLPGCSELHRIMACPGYLRAKKTFSRPSQIPGRSGSDAASAGTAMHEALELMEYVIDGQPIEMTLSAAQQWVVEQCASIVGRITAEIFSGQSPTTMLVEQRMEMVDAGQKILSGKVDKMVSSKTWDWILFDYKTGPKEVPEATMNWQIHGLALCLESWAGSEEAIKKNLYLGGAVYGVIVQPLVSIYPKVVKITPEAARSVRRQVVEAIRRSAMEAQPRIPGAHCAYCPVAGQCFEAQSTGAIMERKFTSVQSLSPAQLAELFKIIPAIEKRCEEVRDHIKRMLFESNDSIPGLELVEQSNGVEVEDKITFLKAVMPTVAKEEFTAALKTPVAKIREIWVNRIAEQRGITKAAATQEWESQVAHAVVPKPKKLIVRTRKDDGKPKEVQA